MTRKLASLTTVAHRTIYDLIPGGSRVLDLGCGKGELLAALMQDKQVAGQGVEIDENHVIECLNQGIPIVQGNLDEGLKEYPDGSYDYVILNQTLQSVYHTELLLTELLRVGKKAVVGIPNFAHWRIRLTLALTGTLPKTSVLNFEWYNTPNIRLVTVKDFKKVCAVMGIRVLEEFYSTGNRALPPPFRFRPNLFCENALFVIGK